ncbi:MAG TPA: alpha/beta fold hydrolase [Gammaproteobacteria bacterium]|nr:alpha/beta fold hydrolase [Gammaproteobacteria bacterium]
MGAPSYVPGTPRLAYEAIGTGPTVVFMHGIGGNRTNWREQLDALAPEFRAVAWDARGYGDSDDYEAALAFPDFAADLLRLLDHLGVAQAHLVGLSMGGRIAMDFYEAHPRRVASLVLCDTFPGYDASITEEQREKFIASRRKPLVEDGKEPRDIAPLVAPTLLGKNAAPAALQRLIDSMAMLHKESYIKAIEAMTRYEPVARLGEFRVPTLVVCGEEDRLTPPAIARDMVARIPDARLAILERAGHLSNIEQPLAFNAVLLDFLRRQR